MLHIKRTALISIFILILAFVIFLPSIYADSGLAANYWWQSLHSPETISSSHNFVLEHEKLELPGGDVQEFSREAQQKLYDVASRFGEENIDKETFYEETEENYVEDQSDADFTLNPDQESGEQDQYTIASRLTLTAEEAKAFTQEEAEKSNPNFSLNYSLSDSATFRAGLGQDSLAIVETDPSQDTDQDFYEDAAEDMEKTEIDLENEQDSVQPIDLPATDWGQETGETGRVGVSYRPAAGLALTADYSQGDLFTSRNSASTIFGLEYDDQLGSIRARYQIDEGEILQQRTTGLQMEVMDFAQFSASYSLLDFEELESKLKQQTSLDLGLDFNFTDFSTFSLGYHWQEMPSEPNEESDESNIRASFTIDF